MTDLFERAKGLVGYARKGDSSLLDDMASPLLTVPVNANGWTLLHYLAHADIQRVMEHPEASTLLDSEGCSPVYVLAAGGSVEAKRRLEDDGYRLGWAVTGIRCEVDGNWEYRFLPSRTFRTKEAAMEAAAEAIEYGRGPRGETGKSETYWFEVTMEGGFEVRRGSYTTQRAAEEVSP